LYLIKSKPSGVTILEVLLALTVATALIVFTFKSAIQLQNQSYVRSLDVEVNGIFQAMNAYYLANCSSYNSSCASGPGLLSPACGKTQLLVLGGGSSTPVNLLTNYIANYPYPMNPLLSYRDTSSSNHGFAAQFFLTTYSRTPSWSQGIATGTIYMWVEQVSAFLANSSKAATYYKSGLQTQPTCITSLNSVTLGPIKCTSPSATSGTFLSWIRIPSTANTSKSSFLPVLKTFNLQYSNSDYYGLITSGNASLSPSTTVNAISCGE
jgi:hypothetical protein